MVTAAIDPPRRRNHPCSGGCGELVGKRDTRCWECYLKARGAESVARARTAISASQKPLYPCLEGCGKQLSQPNQRCHQCRKARQYQIEAHTNRKMSTSRAMQALASGSSKGVMVIGEELWSLLWVCSQPGCGKPMLVKARCYFHATGRAISLTILPRIVLASDIL